ncbi:MAG: thiol reductant ABC exporter subunit CydD [Idiomarina sp.]|nr:thiol reductant ABC exporter subunit CydD [Idiomarina sp.]
MATDNQGAHGGGVLAKTYLRNLQGEVSKQLLLTRGLGGLHALMLVASVVLLAWWVSASIDQAALRWDLLSYAALAMAARVWLNAQAASFAQHLGEHAEELARARLAASWARPESGAAQANTERATLMIEPVAQLYGYYARFLPQLSNALITPLLIAAVVFYFDWIAALFLIAAAPIIPVFMVLVGMGAARLNERHLATTQRIAGLFVDRVRHLTNLQLFKATGLASRDIDEASQQMREANMATLRVAFLSSAVLEFFAAIAIAAVAIYVGFALLGFYDWGPAAQMNLMTGLTVLLLAPEFFQPLRTLSAHYHDRAAALAAAGLLAREQRVSAANDHAQQKSQRSATLNGGVRLENVSFGYPRAKATLDGFKLTIAPGQVVVLNGPSGCGKSTLLKLISGQLQLQQGHISLPDMGHIAYMAQQPYLQSGTIASNLRLVRADATDEDMSAALRQAQLTVDLDHHLLEQGQGLSGGEQRRLALARMFLHPSSLMLFDEPTAGLDAATADAVISGIEKLNDGQRVLLIASHDPKLQSLADITIGTLQ